MSRGSVEAASVWRNACGPDGVVLFFHLAKAYHDQFMTNTPIPDFNKQLQEDVWWRCFAMFLGATQERSVVDPINWERFLYFFKPLGEDTPVKLKDLLSKAWFYGDISGDEAIEVLMADLSREGGMKKVKGKFKKFLVRFSANTKEGDAESKTSSPVKYSVTCFDSNVPKVVNVKPRPEHQRLPHINSTDQLIAFIENHFIKCGWKPAKGNRKYVACFTKFSRGGGVYRSVDHEEKNGSGVDSRWDASAKVTYVP
eukprot:TRINITY_DN10391_c0_g1_i1.p1 TRINITY_DN10391_c0_g1~~TRINITY_DN10391_c0_g1_i1.p1  ORF type:complete len:255 (-),score=46.72 TRINITY_DN10391_c0_g1_i1:215-979(-)